MCNIITAIADNEIHHIFTYLKQHLIKLQVVISPFSGLLEYIWETFAGTDNSPKSGHFVPIFEGPLIFSR